mgnify:CR=1 FL=1
MIELAVDNLHLTYGDNPVLDALPGALRRAANAPQKLAA